MKPRLMNLFMFINWFLIVYIHICLEVTLPATNIELFDCMEHLLHWQEVLFLFGSMHNSLVDLHISFQKPGAEVKTISNVELYISVSENNGEKI